MKDFFFLFCFAAVLVYLVDPFGSKMLFERFPFKFLWGVDNA